jgi:hypothetical protein
MNVCPVCGESFERPRVGRPKVYCSITCYNKMVWQRHRDDEARRERHNAYCAKWYRRNKWKIRDCDVCGREFHPHGRQRCCSHACRLVDRRGGVKSMDKRNCEICGEEFVVMLPSVRSRQKYCSQRCYYRARDRRASKRLTDGYVKNIIARTEDKLCPRDVPQDLVALKRLQIQIDRELRDAKGTDGSRSS